MTTTPVLAEETPPATDPRPEILRNDACPWYSIYTQYPFFELHPHCLPPLWPL